MRITRCNRTASSIALVAIGLVKAPGSRPIHAALPIANRVQALAAASMISLLFGCSGGSLRTGSGADGSVANDMAPPAQRQAAPASELPFDATVEKHRLGIPTQTYLRPPSMVSNVRLARPLLYVTQSNINGVNIYHITGSNTPPRAILSDFRYPQGNGVDKQGNLYVADTYNRRVNVYMHGSTKRIRTLHDRRGYPVDVAVANDGTAYVVNIAALNPYGPGNVSVYKPGSSKPTSTLTCSIFHKPTGVAISHRGEIFVSNEPPASAEAEIVRFPVGSTACVDTGIRIGYAAGIAFDTRGYLLAGDQNAPNINVYKLPDPNPIQVIPCGNCSVFFALDHSNSNLYLSNYSRPGEVDVLSYPAGTFEYAITDGLSLDSTIGISVVPRSPL